MGSMVGIGPSPNDFHDSEREPVYLLTRRRSSVPPPPASFPGPGVPTSTLPSMGRAEEISRERISVRGQVGSVEDWAETTSFLDDEPIDDVSTIKEARHFTRRRRAIRALGVVATLGVLAGGALVLEQPRARREALAFVTLGHPEGAARFGHRIATVVNGFRRR